MIEMTANLIGDQVTVDVAVTTADEAVTGNHKIRICLIDINMIDFWTATNGQNDFHNDMLQYSPDANGLDCEIDANSTETFSVSFPWPIAINGVNIEDDNFKAVAYVQNDDTHEVLNAEWVFPLACNVVLSQERATLLAAAGSSPAIDMEVANVAPFDDVFNIVLETDLPEGWTFQYTTPDGVQTGNSTVNMSANDSFTSVVTFNTDGTPGDGGTATFTVTSDALPELNKTATFYVLASGEVLIVSDSDELYSDFYSASLNNISQEFTQAVWNQSLYDFNTFDLETEAPGIVIWSGGSSGNILADDFAGLESYLDGGGKLWITGSNYPENMMGSDLIEMMGAAFQARYGATSIIGDSGDPYFGSIEADLGGGDGADNLGDPCSLTENGGSACLKYSLVRRAGICNATDVYRTLIMGFPFEAVATAEERDALMQASINFLLENDAPENGSNDLIPAEFSLEQNYPNPFNPSTNINFTLAKPGMVKLAVFDVQGREVAVLIHESLENGQHEITFNAEDLSSGVYFARLSQSGQVQTRKMLLVK